jgi:hypothetical protein
MLTNTYGNSESVPHSKAESIMTQLQEYYLQAANMGKPFLQLCSLVDTRNTGVVSVEELLTVCKMMGYVCSRQEIEFICDILAENTINLEKNRVDYNELNYALEYFVPRDTQAHSNPDMYDSRSYGMRTSGPLNAFTAQHPSPANPRAQAAYLNSSGFLNASMGSSLNRPPSRGPGLLGPVGSLAVPVSPGNFSLNRGAGSPMLRSPLRASPTTGGGGSLGGYPGGYGREHFAEAESFNRIISVVSNRVQGL